MKVMVGVDGSAHADYALAYALKNLVNTERDELLLFTVAEQYSYPVFDDLPETSAAMDQVDKLNLELREGTKTMLTKKVKEAKEAGFSVKGVLCTGDVKECLEKSVKDFSVDLVVVGNRGLNIVKKILLGSVSEFAAHSLGCAVLIVKSDASATSSESREPEVIQTD